MLKKKYRLPVPEVRGRRCVRRAFAYGILTICPSNLPFPRFAVVVGARVARSAAARNALRRFVYQVIQSVWAGLRPCDALIVLAPKAQNADKKGMRNALDALFRPLRK